MQKTAKATSRAVSPGSTKAMAKTGTSSDAQDGQDVGQAKHAAELRAITGDVHRFSSGWKKS